MTSRIAVHEVRRLTAVAMANRVRREQTSAAIELRRNFNADLAAALQQTLEVMREREALLARRKDRLDGLLDGLLRMRSDDCVCHAGDIDDRAYRGGVVTSARQQTGGELIDHAASTRPYAAGALAVDLAQLDCRRSDVADLNRRCARCCATQGASAPTRCTPTAAPSPSATASSRPATTPASPW